MRHQVTLSAVWPFIAITKALSLLLLLGCCLNVKLQALTPGPTFILECPHCREPVRIYSIGSGNTFGAKFWTDGKIEAPMLPDRSPIVKCAKCTRLFWKAKAKQLGRIEVYSVSKEEEERFAKASNALDPTEQDLLNLSEARDLSRDEQVTVRRRAWWLANDRFRSNRESNKTGFSEAQLGNLRRLYSLLDEQDPGERILKSEISRELGNFEECLQLLEKEFEDNGEAARAMFIRELAAKKNSRVTQLPKR